MHDWSLPNNLVLDNLLNHDILYGMVKTYWKPLVRCVGVTDAVSVTGLYLPIQLCIQDGVQNYSEKNNTAKPLI